MAQIHKKFSVEQVRAIFTSYEAGNISRTEIQGTLGVGKTRIFALLKQFRENPDTFSIDYHRSSQPRISADAEEQIRQELQREKELIDDKELPITSYNYAALTDRLKKSGVDVSTTTVIKRAVRQGCYIPKRKKTKPHDREVLTSAIGDLIQHDASLHKWSPYAASKWTLITSLDDYSRMMLFADFFESETSWAHIQSAQYLMQTFGIPNRYYVDNLRVFRFIQNRDSVWKDMVLETDDVNTQWRQVLALLNTDVVYALSPQAKGKIERPYRWLQDRIVRTCALDHVESIDDARRVLHEEVHRYNYLQVHSTTQEIPAIRFENARKNNLSIFRSFAIPKPFSSVKDVFCIRHSRIADGYRRVSFGKNVFQIPGIQPREDVDLHLSFDDAKKLVEIRFWALGHLVHTATLPVTAFSNSVHF